MSKSSFGFTLNSSAAPPTQDKQPRIDPKRACVVDRVFGGDSDEEQEAKPSLANRSFIDRMKAEELTDQDPDIFKYDELYDITPKDRSRPQPQQTKKEEVDTPAGLVYTGKRGSVDAKPKAKYIDNLQKFALRREVEQEIVQERLLKKEREKEADKNEDEEIFVTGGYKKALEKRRKIEEELEKQDAIDTAKDVTKKADLTDFHRILLEKRDLAAKEEPQNDSDRKTVR